MPRIILPDALKAFLICMVVIGHTIGLAYKGQMEDYWYNPMVTFIYSFHMPLFIAISGYFLGKTPQMDIKVQIKKKIQRLGIPILSISILYYMIMIGMLTYNHDDINVIKLIFDGLTCYWFFDCLFILSLFFILTDYFGTRRSLIIQLGMLIVLVVAYPILPSLFRKLQIVRLFPIFLLSFYIGRCNDKIIPLYRKYKNEILLISALLWIACIVFGGVNLLKYSLLLRILIGLFSSLTVLCVLVYLYKYIPLKFVEKGGKNCMGIYIVHAPIFLNLPRIDSPLLIALVTFLLIVLSSVATDMIRKTFLKKYILGEI